MYLEAKGFSYVPTLAFVDQHDMNVSVERQLNGFPFTRVQGAQGWQGDRPYGADFEPYRHV